jgi:hypothetical protein
MKLNILSDLHLSRGELPVPDNGADLVILAGDIGRPAQAMAWASRIAAALAAPAPGVGDAVHSVAPRQRTPWMTGCSQSSTRMRVPAARRLSSRVVSSMLLP